MISITPVRLTLIVAAAFSLVACSGVDDDQSQAEVAAVPQTVTDNPKLQGTAVTASGTHSSPIKFRYEIQGTPVVGQPVSINLFVSSPATDAPINLFFRVNDASSMMFPASQAKQMTFNAESASTGSKEHAAPQQITVIPQREGRLYLVVSAEVAAAGGSMISTTSIPIQVGSAPPELESSGELIETADGETVVSMPAQESD